jgi:hypothetical protein
MEVSKSGPWLSGKTVILFFPPESFSARFANENLIPLTVDLTGWTWSDGGDSCSTRFVEYHLHIRFGREQWFVRKRYSQVLSFYSALVAEYPTLAEETLLSFPPKSWACCGILDTESFLNSRQEQLCKFMVSLLSCLNTRGLLRSFMVTEFLELRAKGSGSGI